MFEQPLILANAASAATLFKVGMLCGGVAVLLIVVAIAASD